jgi:hypothetical protein
MAETYHATFVFLRLKQDFSAWHVFFHVSLSVLPLLQFHCGFSWATLEKYL